MTIQPWEDGFVFTITVTVGATDIDDAYDTVRNIVKQLKKQGLIEDGHEGQCDQVLPGGAEVGWTG